MSVKKASSAPEIKTQNSNSDSSGSNWNLIDDDCFDDLVRDFDIPNDADAFNTSASKFTRHKSMPQPQPQTSSSCAAPSTSSTISKSKVSMRTTTAATAAAAAAAQQQSNAYQNNFSRKSFTRHESMPIGNHSTMNRLSNASNSTNNSSMRPNSSMFVALHFRSIPYQMSYLSMFQFFPVFSPLASLPSSQTRKCTSEEIAEKRRQALERLKNRNKPKPHN